MSDEGSGMSTPRGSDLPAEIGHALRDRSVVSQSEHELLRRIEAWTSAPSLTMSAPRFGRPALESDRFVWTEVEVGGATTGSRTPSCA